MACGRKTISHEKKKNREGIQGRYYDVKKKNCFSKFYGKVGVISWLHLQFYISIEKITFYTENKILKII